jgi:aldehyde dehydrogenase (NAD+)
VLSYYDKGVKAGGRPVLEATKPAEAGYFVSPWLLEGDPGNVCFREEIFGPAAFLTKFKSEGQAVEMIHSVDYGLANSVWTRDLAKANRFAEDMAVGNTWINAHNVFAYGLPYGGINRSGMGGGVNSPATFYDYLRDHTIARPL